MQWWPVWVLRASGLKDSWINLLLILSSSLHPHEFRPKTAFMVVFIIVSSLSSNSHQSHNVGIIGQRLTTIGGQQPMFWGFRSQTSDIGKSLFNINIRVSDYPLVLPLLVAKHLQERTPLVDLFFWDVHIVMLAGFVSDLYQHLWPGDFENHRKKWDQWRQRYIGTISHSPVDFGMIVCKKSHLRPPNSGQRMPLFLSSSFQEAVVTVQSWRAMYNTFSLWQKQAEQRRSQSTLTSADQSSFIFGQRFCGYFLKMAHWLSCVKSQQVKVSQASKRLSMY